MRTWSIPGMTYTTLGTRSAAVAVDGGGGDTRVDAGVAFSVGLGDAGRGDTALDAAVDPSGARVSAGAACAGGPLVPDATCGAAGGVLVHPAIRATPRTRP